jgi:hypothetical protein
LSGRTAKDAFRNHIEELQKALGCLVFELLSVPRINKYELNLGYSVTLNELDPLPLRGTVLSLQMAHTVTIVSEELRSNLGERFSINVVDYLYRFSEATSKNREVLAFHWTPEDNTTGVITFPHMHIESALLANQQVIRPKDLHKAHIPTGPVSLGKIIWLAIEEFGARPIRANCQAIIEEID